MHSRICAIGFSLMTAMMLCADVEMSVMRVRGVQLWENGPLWAECNIGASKPEESGYYFWWGDTVGYARVGDSWNAVNGSKTGFSFCAGNCLTYGKDRATLKSQGYIDSTGSLAVGYDAAAAHLGAPWRMPTDAEWSALISNCTTTWTARNGVYGRLVTGKGAYASKSIFLPAAGLGVGSGLSFVGSGGYYWSSVPDPVGLGDARNLYFFYPDYFYRSHDDRDLGLSVRPLRRSAR